MNEWLAEMVSVPVKEYLQFEAALSFLPALPPDEVPALLRQRCAALEVLLDQIEAATDGSLKRGLPRLFFIEADYQVALMRRELEFARDLADEIDAGTISRPRLVAQLVPGRRRAAPRRRLDTPTDRRRRHRTMTTPIIEAQGLTKRFGKVQALAGLDLVAQPGQVVAVLGPNGAGKTTFVRTVATLLRPDGGSLHVAGIDALRDPRQVRRVIGLAGQYAAVEEAMTGRENLVMVARLFGHDRRTAAANAEAVLDQLDLTDAADRLVRTYSGGMRRRLDLGASLVGGPACCCSTSPPPASIPAAGSSCGTPSAASWPGTDVLLTTQYLEEADQLAHKVVIIDKGAVIADGSPDELKARAGRDVIEVHARRVDDLARLAAALAPIGADEPRIDEATRRVTVPVDGGRAAISAAVRAVDDTAPRSTTSACAGRPSTRSSSPSPASRYNGDPDPDRRGRRGLTLDPHPETHPMTTTTPTVTSRRPPGRLDIAAAARTPAGSPPPPRSPGARCASSSAPPSSSS